MSRDGKGYCSCTVAEPRPRAAVFAARIGKALAQGLFLFAFALVASPAAAQPVFNSCQNDVDGPNDQPNQKDLTKFCVEPGTGVFEIWTKWNWDEIVLSGNNTGDACSLYDTDGDGNVNIAVCVTWDGTATLRAVRLFNCTGDSKPQNCDGAQLLNYCSNDATRPCLQNTDCVAPGQCVMHDMAGNPDGQPKTTCTLSQSGDDPFLTDDAFPLDTQAVCG